LLSFGIHFTYFEYCVETEDGYVEVTGFTENAPTLVRYAVKVGDRVLAVDSSLGDKMWPVSTVEGVISAVTSRLPGRPITFCFERPVENFDKVTDLPAASTAVQEPTVDATRSTIGDAELLKRCRDIIKRYTVSEKGKGNFVNKYDVPVLVADKVLDALASAEARVDAVTLSMIMSAYLSCRQAQKAIDTFEAVIGQRADASTDEAIAAIVGGNGKKLVANEAALDVYTVSALLNAHAMIGDLSSVKRVLAAVEGQAGIEVGGMEVALWPGTGVDGSLKPDTRCYNTVISAAANSRAKDGLELAMDIFDSMSEPKQPNREKQKDLVSYNIILNALTNRGRYQDVVELFYKMKKVGVKPDKLSYTSLAKAITSDIDVEGDIEELFYDMKEQGVVADVVTYNTAIKSLCKQRRIGAARKIVDVMEGSGVSPDSMTYGLLMKGLIDTGYAGASLTLFETACSDRRTVVLTENVYLYTTAISAAASLGDHERALELLSRMKSIGVKPNMKTLTAIIGACLSAGKPDLAVDVYRRIAKPDGYAMTQGLQALCESGNTEEALALIAQDNGKNGVLTGKQVMRSFTTLIQTELRRADFDMARKVLTALIHGGHIPSKDIYRAIFDAMKVFPQKRKGLEIPEDADTHTTEKFQFLLFLLDSIASRNLPCEGPLYSGILSYGFRVGGLPNKVASYLVTARADFSDGEKLIDDNNFGDKIPMFRAWEDLFLRHNEMKSRIATDGPPRLVVRAASRDLPSILKAERNLSYRRTRMV
jgi:pentatricopeptide repeat protein